MADSESHIDTGRKSFGPFRLSPTERLLTRDGSPVDIGGRSFDLLMVLTEQPGRVLSKRELLKRVWPDVVVENGSLRFHMAGLRKLLGDGKDGVRYIATQVGVGYAFVAPVTKVGAAEPGSEMSNLRDAERKPVPVTSNLPARLPRLIGREQDVKLLLDRVVTTQLFTILGSAGVGKTTLAIEVAHQLAHRFDNQVVFVDFGMLENPELVPSMIAGAMGIAVLTEDPLAVVLGHLRDREFLLVLDNCEHVIDPAAMVIERVIEGAPLTRIVATSREPLRVRGEHIHRLDALGFPENPRSLTFDDILSYPAVQLFWERASAADSSLVWDAEAANLIADLCRRLDGLALPIELAAVRVATHGLAATAQQLGERFSLAWSGRRTALPRQQTLQATLDWSYDLLTEVQRIVLNRLSVFVGPFSLDAALHVVSDAEMRMDEVAAALDELTSKSLVAPDRSRGTGTYRLLEMTRAYAREKLIAHGDREIAAVSARHAEFFLGELEAISGQHEDALQDVRALRQQLGNIRSALEWSFSPSGDSQVAVRLAAASAPIFLNLSHLIECRAWCAQALAEMTDSERGTAIELELQAALGISLMFTRGNSEAAGNALTRALEVARALDDRWSELRMLGRLHIFHERIGEYRIASSHASRAVSVAERIGEPEALGVAYSLSGISQHLAGDQTRARRELELSLENSAPSRRSRTIHYGFDHRNRSAIALARVLWLSGHAEQARRIARQTVREASELDHPVTRCIALIWSLTVHIWMEDLDSADAALEAFADCAEVNALGPYISAAGGFRGELAIQRGTTGEALGALEESLARLRAARYELQTTLFSLALARGLLLDSRVDEACEVVDATIARCHANGELFAMPELLRVKADIVRQRPNSKESGQALLQEARSLAKAQGARAWELRASLAVAQLLLDTGRREEAAGFLEELRSGFREAGDAEHMLHIDQLLAPLGTPGDLQRTSA